MSLSRKKLDIIHKYITSKDVAKIILKYIEFTGAELYKNTRNHDMFFLVVLPNGDIGCSSFDNKIYIYHKTVIKYTLDNGTTDRINFLSVLPNGDLVSGSWGNIRIWRNNICIHTLSIIVNVRALGVLSNGDLVLASGDPGDDHEPGADGEIQVWHLNKDIYECINTLETSSFVVGCNTGVKKLIIMKNDDMAVSIYNNNNIYIVNNNTLKCVLSGHTQQVTSLAILSNGDLVSGSVDHTIKIWRDYVNIETLYGAGKDVECQYLTDNIIDCGYGVSHLVVTPEDDIICSFLSGCIIVWRDNKVKKVITRYDIREYSSIYGLHVLPDNNLVVRFAKEFRVLY